MLDPDRQIKRQAQPDMLPALSCAGDRAGNQLKARIFRLEQSSIQYIGLFPHPPFVGARLLLCLGIASQKFGIRRDGDMPAQPLLKQKCTDISAIRQKKMRQCSAEPISRLIILKNTDFMVCIVDELLKPVSGLRCIGLIGPTIPTWLGCINTNEADLFATFQSQGIAIMDPLNCIKVKSIAGYLCPDPAIRMYVV